MDIVLAITEVSCITEAAACAVSLVTADTTEVVTLLHRTERRANIFQLVVDVQRHFTQPHDQPQNSDGRDQNQFRRNNETRFVVLQGIDELEHQKVFRAWGLLFVPGESHRR